MKRYIQRNIETLIAKKILEDGADKQDEIIVSYQNGAYQAAVVKGSAE